MNTHDLCNPSPRCTDTLRYLLFQFSASLTFWYFIQEMDTNQSWLNRTSYPRTQPNILRSISSQTLSHCDDTESTHPPLVEMNTHAGSPLSPTSTLRPYDMQLLQYFAVGKRLRRHRIKKYPESNRISSIPHRPGL